MFQPLSLFIGLRYVRARQHKFFVSFITWVSLAGVALGVAALIVVLSVMNGLEGEVRNRLLSLSAHARVVSEHSASLAADPALEKRLRALPGVVGVAPYTDLQALALHQPEMLPITLRGIDPAAESQVTNLKPLLLQGHLEDLKSGSNALILGRSLAEQLGVDVGGKITILVPVVTAGAAPEASERQFTVTGIFEAGYEDLDGALALGALDDVRAFAPQAVGGSGWRLRFTDALAVPQLIGAVRAAASGAEVHDWTEDNASYFRAIRIEKTMMALLLLLIVGVAAFNIVAMLVMVVTEKRTDIAILRTLGAAPRRIMAVFLTQGLVIGWFGVFSGVALGVTVALNVARIEPALERAFHFNFLDADVYSIAELPSELQVPEVVWIAVAALVLTLLATIYPAWRASRTSPADALRYE
jgi:lipoprotein-releasing system permease protein